jgi:toxin ParE1/3/4
MNWTFNQSALHEYQEAAEWYRERSLQAAERFIFEVETAIHAICADPGRYQPVGEGVHVYRLRRFPFRIYYLPETEQLTIYAVMHERREPEYWRARLS